MRFPWDSRASWSTHTIKKLYAENRPHVPIKIHFYSSRDKEPYIQINIYKIDMLPKYIQQQFEMARIIHFVKGFPVHRSASHLPVKHLGRALLVITTDHKSKCMNCIEQKMILIVPQYTFLKFIQRMKMQNLFRIEYRHGWA